MTRPRLTVDVVADVVCPWCYVGLKAFLASRDQLADRFDIVPRLRPYELNPSLPAEGVDRHAFYAQKFPDADRLAAARAAIKENAQRSGFSFDPAAPARLPNTLKAHQIIGLAHLEGRQEAAALGVYRAFWDELRDIGDDGTLIAVARAAGLNEARAAAALASIEDREAVAAEAEAFRRAGVSGVPTFIVNERMGFSGGMAPDQMTAALIKAAAISTGAEA